MLLAAPEFNSLDGSGSITLHRDFIYYLASHRPRVCVRVPRGFILFAGNRASFLRHVLKLDAKCIWPLLLMDYLYLRGGALKDVTLSRKQCDRVIKKALIESGTHPRLRRVICFYLNLRGHRWWHNPTLDTL